MLKNKRAATPEILEIRVILFTILSISDLSLIRHVSIIRKNVLVFSIKPAVNCASSDIMSLDVNISEPDEFNCNELHGCIKTVAEIKCIEDFTYHVDYLSGKGENYIANVFRVLIKDSVKTDNNVSVIVKTLVNTTRQELFHELHKREVLAYRDVISKFKELQMDLDIDDQIILPKCITFNMTKGKEVIILEDLLLNGFEIETKAQKIEQMNLEQVSSIMKEMAKFHALSFVYEKIDPEKYENTSNEFYDLIFQDSFICNTKLKNHFIESYEMSLNIIADVEATKKLENIKTKLFEILKTYTRPQKYNVFCHGDCWINNILFRHEENKTNICFLDFQAMRYASPVTDIIYFLYICTDSQFRSDHIEDIKKVYYSSLESFLKLFQIDVNVCYPFHEFESDMKEFMLYGLIIALLELRIATISREDVIDSVGSEAEEIKTPKYISQETLFETRVNDVVKEAITNGTLDKLCKITD